MLLKIIPYDLLCFAKSVLNDEDIAMLAARAVAGFFVKLGLEKTR